MTRCDDCGRFLVTDRQLYHWFLWSQRDLDRQDRKKGYRVKGTGYPQWTWWLRVNPWWSRWSLKCMGWHDCPAGYPPGTFRTTRYMRRRLRKLVRP